MTKHKHGNRWHSESIAPKDLIESLYEDGLSTREIAEKLGYSHSYIHILCADVIRNRRDAAILASSKLEQSDSWRAYRARARKLMEDFVGRKLESYEHVHHIDGNYINNDINNLEIKTASDHAKHHHPKNPIARHLREDRKQYMKEYNKKRRIITRICRGCKNTFETDKYNQKEYCSFPCTKL